MSEMAFAVYDKIAKRIIKDPDELMEMKVLQLPNGRLVIPERLYGHQTSYVAYVDVSHRYAPLHKVGCG